MKRVYLLTGRPGTGKTSLVKQVVARVRGKAGGFYTEEIRSRGMRQGFRLITLDGRGATLSSLDIDSSYRVSKYGVDIDSLDRVGVFALLQAAEECDLVVVDEIGKMELLSAKFRETVLQIIDSGQRVLGTIMLGPNQWADDIKRKPQVNLVEVTRANHHKVLGALLRWLRATDEEKD
jgi:nucleoside-triphosphatase